MPLAEGQAKAFFDEPLNPFYVLQHTHFNCPSDLLHKRGSCRKKKPVQQ